MLETAPTPKKIAIFFHRFISTHTLLSRHLKRRLLVLANPNFDYGGDKEFANISTLLYMLSVNDINYGIII